MPLIVHTRSAEKETIEILRKNLKKKVLRYSYIALPDQENLHSNS